jgi:hypothetical protein
MKAIFKKFRINAAFAKAPELVDCAPEVPEVSTVSSTPTGDWITLFLPESKQAVRVDLGELAHRHNSGEDILVDKRPVKEGQLIELRPDLIVGIKNGSLVFA